MDRRTPSETWPPRVDDVPASAAQAEQLGGQVIIPPQVLPDGDEVAIVMDREGLSFGLVKARNASARR